MPEPSPLEILEILVGPGTSARLLRLLDQGGYTFVAKAELESLRSSAAQLAKLLAKKKGSR